jgi:hypothetical protein
MTEIDLLKRVRDDIADPDPLVLARARGRLFNSPPVRRHGTRRRVLIAGGLAVALGGGFLVTDVVSRNHAVLPGATADAATFLSDAAVRTGANPDTPIPPGHFRQITVESSMIDTFTSNPELRATIFGRTDTWIPATPTERYVRRTTKNARVEFPSAAARTAARKVAPYLFDQPRTTLGLSLCSDPKGAGDPSRCEASWTTPTPAFLARQPRDPELLLAVLRKDTTGIGHPSTPDLRAFLHVSAALNSGLVPADLRAALYKAAAMIPGIQLGKDVVTLDGRKGRAIGFVDNDIRKELVISGDNGAYIGALDVIVGSGRHMPGLRTGDNLNSYSVSTRIVATEPAVK